MLREFPNREEVHKEVAWATVKQYRKEFLRGCRVVKEESFAGSIYQAKLNKYEGLLQD
jgi:hypothetical protein